MPTSTTTSFWSRPWTGGHLGLVCATLFGIAVAAQISHPALSLRVPPAPWNWPVAMLPALGALLAARDPLVQRVLGGVPLALWSLALLAIACIPLAVWPTGVEAPPWLNRWGLGDPLHGLPLALALALVQVNLAATLVRQRSSPRFLLVHLGILVALISGVAGAGSLQRGKLMLRVDGPASDRAIAEDGQPLVLPFTLRLVDFTLESFAPTLVLASADRQRIRGGEVLLGPTAQERIDDVTVTVDEWLPACAVVAGTPQPYHERGAGPAARVTATSAGTTIASGWLHAPSPYGGDLRLDLPDGRVLVMAPPRPRSFTSTVVDGSGTRHAIAVNRPLVRDGWAVSQLSYDERLGGASPVSVLDVVEDRALPGVYAGIVLLLLGVLGHGAGALSGRARTVAQS